MLNYLKTAGLFLLGILTLGISYLIRQNKALKAERDEAKAKADYEHRKRVNAEQTAEKYINDAMTIRDDKDERIKQIQQSEGDALDTPIPEHLRRPTK